MTDDPRRLLDGEGSAFERELLGSLARERPPRALTRRMRQGLVAVGLLTSAKTGVAGLIALAGLASVGVGGTWLALRQPAEVADRNPPPAVTVAARASATPAPSAIESAAPLAAPPATSTARPTTAPSAAGDLKEQIASLDRARSALRSGNNGAALAELAQYPRKFPRGEFAQEVAVLKIEALVQSGQLGPARSLAKSFVSAHPESPHVERIERLVGTTR